MLSIVIVSYNSFKVLRECQHELLSSNKYPVIVVDNASRDGSADLLEQHYPHLQVIRMPINEGYGRAANKGFAAVTTPYAFLLNPDMQPTIQALDEMLEFAIAHKGQAALFAPAVDEKDYVKNGAVNREWVIGAALFLDMAAFKEIGFFDPNIFLFSEETDLCHRLIKSGKKILLNTNLFIRHLSGQSSAPNPKIDRLKDWHFGWSKLYFLEKHSLVANPQALKKLQRKYVFKKWIAIDPVKRQQYANRAAGMLAYINGEKAFLSDGRGQGTDKL